MTQHSSLEDVPETVESNLGTGLADVAAPELSGPGSFRDRAGARLSHLLQVKTLVLLAVILVIAYLTLTPLVFLVHGTFFDAGNFTLDGFSRAYTTSGVLDMARNSLVFAIGTSSLSLVLGTTLAYVTIRTNVPFKSLLIATALVPLIIPGLLYTIAWIMLSSSNIGFINQVSTSLIGRPVFDVFSMLGMIWVEGTDTTPLVFLFMTAAFRSMDPSLEEAALVSGASRWTMMRRVTLPLVRPALAGAMLIVAIRALESFEVPALLGLPDGLYVFTSRIFHELTNFPYDYNAAGALSLSLVAIAIIGVYSVNRVGAKSAEHATVTGKGFRPQPLDLGRARPVVTALVLLYFTLTTVLPFLVMLYTSFLPYYQRFSFAAIDNFSLNNYREVFANDNFTEAVKNSIFLSLGSATAIMFLTGIGAWFVVRTRIPGRQAVDHLTFLPMIVPGLVMGVAISFVYLRNPLPFSVYGTIWILLIAYTTRFMPYGMRYAVPSLTQISSELEESAAVSGATWWQTNRRILLPLMVPGLLAGWVYIVIVSIRELSSSILLYSPGNEVISIIIWQFYEKGQLTTVSAIAVVLVTSLTIFVAIAYKIGAQIGVRAD